MWFGVGEIWGLVMLLWFWVGVYVEVVGGWVGFCGGESFGDFFGYGGFDVLGLGGFFCFILVRCLCCGVMDGLGGMMGWMYDKCKRVEMELL